MVEVYLSKKYPNKKRKPQIISVWKLTNTLEFTKSGFITPSLPLCPGQTPKSLEKTKVLFLKSLCKEFRPTLPLTALNTKFALFSQGLKSTHLTKHLQSRTQINKNFIIIKITK